MMPMAPGFFLHDYTVWLVLLPFMPISSTPFHGTSPTKAILPLLLLSSRESLTD
jgi:hypothetical protein